MPSTEVEVQYVLCCEIEANLSVLNGKFIHNFFYFQVWFLLATNRIIQMLYETNGSIWFNAEMCVFVRVWVVQNMYMQVKYIDKITEVLLIQ